MVDVGEKPVSSRFAAASAVIEMQASTLTLLMSGQAEKGDVLATARIAGIMATKRTSELIPLCHPIRLTQVEVDLNPCGDTELHVLARVSARDRTGVEMDAMTAVSVAALTVYDMLKAVDRAMVIRRIQLDEKRGGRSGDYRRSGSQSND